MLPSDTHIPAFLCFVLYRETIPRCSSQRLRLILDWFAWFILSFSCLLSLKVRPVKSACKTLNVTSSSRVYHYHPWPSQHYHSAKLLHPGWAWPVHLLPCFCVCVLVTQSCPTLCDPMDCSSLGSAVHTVLQARILEWIAIPLSRGSSQPRYRTPVSSFASKFFTLWATREVLDSTLALPKSILPMEARVTFKSRKNRNINQITFSV